MSDIMIPEDTKGLSLDIYHGPYGDCSNGGVSTSKNLTLVGVLDLRGVTHPRITRELQVQPLPASSRGPFQVSEDSPAVVLVWRHFNGRDIAHLEPLAAATGAGWMHGGTYATGDSRLFNLLPFYGAVAVHDRQEFSR